MFEMVKFVFSILVLGPGYTPQSSPVRRRSVAQQGNPWKKQLLCAKIKQSSRSSDIKRQPCCSSSTPWRRTSSFRNLPHRRQSSRCWGQEKKVILLVYLGWNENCWQRNYSNYHQISAEMKIETCNQSS